MFRELFELLLDTLDDLQMILKVFVENVLEILGRNSK
mgnify:CR=1 FL=1